MTVRERRAISYAIIYLQFEVFVRRDFLFFLVLRVGSVIIILMMCTRPKCKMPSFMFLGTLVLEKMYEGVFVCFMFCFYWPIGTEEDL